MDIRYLSYLARSSYYKYLNLILLLGRIQRFLGFAVFNGLC